MDFRLHIPNYYIAGIYIHSEDTWVGEFAATNDKLVNYGLQADLNELEMILVSDMVEAQEVYQNWWENIRREK